MPLTLIVGPSIGNVTANTVTAATFYAGANVYMNTTAVFVGNATVNVVITSSSVTSSNTVVANGYSVSLVAGETLAALNAVYVEPTLTSGTAGRVYKMDADVLVKSTQAFFAGFALAAANAAANVAVQISGVVSGLSGLTTGAVYYASGTAGAITATKPLHPIPLGMAISATQLLINTGIKRETEQTENVGAIYGYAMGGETGVTVATTDRITFSTSVTAASTVSNLSVARGYMTGLSDCAVYGYVMAGWQTGGTYHATTDRITFSTSVTAASTVSNLSVARYGAACVSDGSVYGYAMGGHSGAYVATADRITFSTSVTAASTVSNLSVGRRISGGGVSDGSVYGYAMGGYTGAYLATTDRITFSTSVTAASTVSNLSGIRVGTAGVSDGSVYGYAMGGSSGAYVSTADRITFSTSVTAASTVSNLTGIRGYAAGLSDGAV